MAGSQFRGQSRLISKDPRSRRNAAWNALVGDKGVGDGITLDNIGRLQLGLGADSSLGFDGDGNLVIIRGNGIGQGPPIIPDTLGRWPLHDTAGTIAYDVSGGASHGTLEGTFEGGDDMGWDTVHPSVTEAVRGSLDFTGSLNGISLGQPALLDWEAFSEERTILLWYKNEAAQDQGDRISHYSRSAINHTVFTFGTTGTQLYSQVGGTFYQVPFSTFPTLNLDDTNWHHIALVNYNDAGVFKSRVVADGTVIMDGNVSGGRSTVGSAFDWMIAGRRGLTNNVGDIEEEYAGRICDVRMYSTALSTVEVVAIADGTEPTGKLPLEVDRSVNSGLEYLGGELRVRIKPTGGIARDNTGLRVLVKPDSGLDQQGVGLLVDLKPNGGLVTDADGLWVGIDPASPLLTNSSGVSFSISDGLGRGLAVIPDTIGRWALQETSGITAADTSVNTNDGTLEGVFAGGAGSGWDSDSPAIAAVSGSLDFIGTPNAVSLGQPVELDWKADTEERTIMWWYKNASPGQGGMHLAHFASGATHSVFYVQTNSTRFTCLVGGVSTQVFFSALPLLNLEDTNWHHFALVVYDDAGTKKFRVVTDGEELGTGMSIGTKSTVTSDRDWLLGGTRWVDNTDILLEYNGNLSDVRMYDHALTTGEIAAIAGGAEVLESPVLVALTLDAGLEFSSGDLQVKIKPDGGLVRDADGLSLESPAGRWVVTTVKTGAYTGAVNELIQCDPSGGAFTITLPTASGIAGKQITVKNITTSTNPITVDGDGSETLDGSTTVIITVGHAALLLVSDGANWMIT